MTLCEHPNENPHVCPCATDCYCKASSCKTPELEAHLKTLGLSRPVRNVLLQVEGELRGAFSDLKSAYEAQVEFLLKALAYEADVVEAHFAAYRSFPKGRRRMAEEQVTRMRALAMRKFVPYVQRSVDASYAQLKKEPE